MPESPARDLSPPPTAGTAPVWDAGRLRNPHGQHDKADRVRAMFDAIAPTYERVNTVASVGRDAAWRRRAITAAGVRAGDVALDVCCGTGDMVRLLGRCEPRPARIIGIDFSAQMLARGDFRAGVTPVTVLRADALRLPLADGCVDVITCAFGVRNFRDVQAGLAEMARVARPGARVVILEFANPERAVLRWAHRMYNRVVLPRLAAWISRDRSGAYRYLPSSIQSFEPPAVLAERLERAGFEGVGMERMNLGGVALFRATRPAGAAR